MGWDPSEAPSRASAGPGSKLALGALVSLVVLSPWPFGSVDPWATRTIAIVAGAAALVAIAWDAHRGVLQLAAPATWAWLGLSLLAAVQLVPLPTTLHVWLAPGTAAVWHPDVREAAAVLGVGSHPISLHPEATRRWLALTVGIATLALAAAPALRERRLLLRATVAIVAGGAAVALYGLVARLVFPDRIYGVFRVPTVSPFGPFVSKNHFAGYVELAALLAVGLASGLADEARRDKGFLSWIESRRAKWVVLAWGVAFVLVLAVLVSLSRGGVVALSAGLLAFVLLRLWSRGPSRLAPRGVLALLVLLVAGGAAVVWILPADARVRVASLGAVTSETSGYYRLAVWRDTRRLVASSPLVGSGFGAYEDALRRFRTASGEVAVEHAESDVLEALAEGGALAALGLLWLVGGLVLSGLRAARSEPQRLPRGVVSGALAGLLALGVHSLFDFNLHLPSNALLASALAAVLVAAASGASSAPASRGMVLATGAGLVLALATTWQPAGSDAGPLLRAAPGPATSLRRAALERELVTSLRRRPADASAWLALAWLQETTSGASGEPLVGWACRLDPSNSGLARAAERLSKAASN